MNAEKMIARSLTAFALPGHARETLVGVVKTMREKMPERDMLILPIEVVEELLGTPE